jgi:hypothetical protein
LPVACDPTSIDRESWGRIKSKFRSHDSSR